VERQGEDHGRAAARPIGETSYRRDCFVDSTGLPAMTINAVIASDGKQSRVGQEPTRPSCGLDGSAKLRFGMRPASRARRPASTAARIAAAIRRGSCDLAIAVLAITASQPSSIAKAASEAVPMPASSTTGTGLREQINSIAAGLAIPIPEPISEPNGITAAQPTSASFWQATGSSLQ